MNSKEAIKILSETTVTPHMTPDNVGKWDEAIRMAISALKQRGIVMCKDCKHSKSDLCFGERECSKRNCDVCDDFSCPYGERKQKGNGMK